MKFVNGAQVQDKAKGPPNHLQLMHRVLGERIGPEDTTNCFGFSISLALKPVSVDGSVSSRRSI